MAILTSVKKPGVLAALGAALLFGAGTPLAKLLLDDIGPWLLAALLYLGSGLGMALYRQLIRAAPVKLPRNEWPWLLGAIGLGGVSGPVLLMIGLRGMPASGASLLLNAESVFTALLAWLVFRENVDRRLIAGMLAIVAGAAIISWPGDAQFAGLWPALAILGACLAWGIDNNLTRKLSLSDAAWLASIKGLAAGSVNLLLALVLGSSMPALSGVAGALLLGCLAYGVSLALFVVALRHLGSARTGAYFSAAPFFGAVLSLLLGDPLTLPLFAAGLLMAFGLWLHLTEHHEHDHDHPALQHSHEHRHDDLHHDHRHAPADGDVPPDTAHNHLHAHLPSRHRHVHFPDAHHQHRHGH